VKPCAATALDWLSEWRRPSQDTALLAVGAQRKPAEEVDLHLLEQPQAYRLEQGDWFALYSREANSAQILTNRGAPLNLIVSNPQRGRWIRLEAADMPRTFDADQRTACELAILAFPVTVPIHRLEDVLPFVRNLEQPEGLQILRGERIAGSPGLVDLRPHDHAIELRAPRPRRPLPMTLPVRLTGLNRRWSAGLFQRQGYVKGDYGGGRNRYRALGMDVNGDAYIPLYANWADQTHVLAGHPVAAGPEANSLFIEVTRVSDDPPRFHVSVNNPTDQTIATTLRVAMPMPGLDFQQKRITLPPGAYMVVQ
jgi:hypothetical protein